MVDWGRVATIGKGAAMSPEALVASVLGAALVAVLGFSLQRSVRMIDRLERGQDQL